MSPFSIFVTIFHLIALPIPKVNLLEVGELEMALHFSTDETVSAVCQGFIAPGIAGEALLLFSDSDFAPMAEILKHKESNHIEVLTDVAGVLLGAILNGLGHQLHLHLTFSIGYPTVLNTHTHTLDLIEACSNKWRKTLAIEVTFEIPSRSIICDVLLLFTEESQETMDERIV